MSSREKLRSIRGHHARYGTLPPWATYGLDKVRITTNTSRLVANRPNGEGLTFEEWLLAANPELGNRIPAYPTLKMLRESPVFRRYVKPWRDGEDPTEWRAALAA